MTTTNEISVFIIVQEEDV